MKERKHQRQKQREMGRQREDHREGRLKELLTKHQGSSEIGGIRADEFWIIYSNPSFLELLMNILVVMTGHIHWALTMWETPAEPPTVSIPTIPHNYYHPHFTKEWTETLSVLPKHTTCGLLSLKSRPTHLLPHMAHLLFVHTASALRMCRPGRTLSQLTRLLPSPILRRPSPEESWEGRQEEPRGSALCSLTPRTRMWSRWNPDPIQDSHCPVWLFWHFIWRYLFILFKIHLCSQVGNQSTQTDSFSRDVLPPSERERMWEREVGLLTDVWKESYPKAKSLVCLCMLGLWTKCSGCAYVSSNKFTAVCHPTFLRHQ